jgi:hypothetical protein
MNRQEAIKICNDNGYEIIAFMCKLSVKVSEKTQITGVLVSVDSETYKKLSVADLSILSGQTK